MNESVNKNAVLIVLIVVLVALFITFFGFGGKEAQAPTPEENSDEVITTEDTAYPGTDKEVGGITHAPSTEEVPAMGEVNETPPAPTPTPIVPENTMVVVTYTNSGFIPPIVEVEQGKSVTFVNSSSKPMWVTSAYHPTATKQLYPEFDQGRSVPSGGTYTFLFTKIGVWGYKNLNFEDHLGAISVVAQ